MQNLKPHQRLIFLTFQSIIISLVVVILLFVGLTVAPAVEGKLFPVVRDMTITKLDGDYYHVEGNKVRPCKYLGMEGLMRTPTAIKKAEFTFFDSPNAERPVGRQSFGVWKIEPEGELVALFVRHQCHSFWTTTTNQLS